MDLYAGDPLLGPALAAGLQAQGMAADRLPGGDGMTGPYRDLAGDAAVARTVGQDLGRLMTAPSGPTVAVLSLVGFDTHVSQGAVEGLLSKRLAYLDATMDGLRGGLGPAWNDTVTLIVTEFGRTARVNGGKGTDHGTASTALVLGGAVRGTGMIGDWPTLEPASLFENRDTAPALDMRALFKGVLQDHLGLDRAALDTAVFPDSATIAPYGGLVA